MATLNFGRIRSFMAVPLACTLFAGVLPRSAFADEVPSANAVIDFLDKKHSQLANLKFEYEVVSNTVDATVRGSPREDEKILRHTQEAFASLEPANSQEPLNWIYWLVRSERQGRTPIASFFVYDGKTYRRFLQGLPEDPREVPYNAGLIDAGYLNTFLAENYFERILFMKLNGASQNLEAHKKSKLAAEFRLVERAEHLGHKGWIFERVWVPGELKKRTLVLGEPVLMVVKHQTVSIPTDKVLAEFEVDELSQIGGKFYPSKGHYSEAESGRSYSFTVTGVTELDDSDRADWFPKWPGGTGVRDIVGGKPFEVERTAEEIQELMKSAKAKLRGTRPEAPEVPYRSAP